MNLKRTVLCVFIAIAALFVFVGCGENTKAKDAEIHQKLMSNAWVPVEDDKLIVDEEGNILQFSVYEFAETLTKVHIVTKTSTNTFQANNYTIKEGKFRADVDGVIGYARVAFDEDGNLQWITDDMVMSFRPLTEAEIVEFSVPVGKTMTFEEGWDDIPDVQ